MDTVIKQNICASFDFPVHFTRDLFHPNQTLLRDVINRDRSSTKRAVLFIDKGVAQSNPQWTDRIAAWFQGASAAGLTLVKPPHVVCGGEAIKNDYRLIMEIVDTILEYRLCRHSTVIVVGGGAVLDAIGFAASIVHRGMRLVRIPSTTLAQNDAGIGVKNGMNLHGGKNTIGTFHPPFAVLNDLNLLDSLPQIHWIAGVAEAFKVALIKDADFFAELCRNATRFRERDAAAQERMIVRCAQLHLDHIRTSGDPFELGSARPLDFGHWAAHKLESMSNYAISHGEAVAIGMMIDCQYAVLQNWIDAATADRLGEALQNTGFTLWHPIMDRRLGDGELEILGGLDDFREHLGGKLCLTFPHGVGAQREENLIDRSAMIEALRRVQTGYASAVRQG